MKKKIEKESGSVQKFGLSGTGHCCAFTSYYMPQELFSFAFDFCKYGQNKKNIEKACKKLSARNQVIAKLNHEFSAYRMLEFGFSMGYVMGQLYNVKDRKHLPVIKRLFKEHLVNAEQGEAEKKGVPYLGKATKRIERKAA
jgi:hypothetical protein